MAKAENGAEWDIYLLAGIGSTAAIFRECKRELRRRFQEAGRDPVIRELLPYGDDTQSILRQLLEVGTDLARLRLPGKWRSGGREAAEQIRQSSMGRRVLLIGHSGGGVAAYEAAVILRGEGAITDFRIVQVGSPKVPIRIVPCDRVSYFVAVDENGQHVDSVTRLGSWGGWRRNNRGLLYWDRYKYAPGHIGTITVLGGHQHYFRNNDPFIHPVRGSNLSLTLDSIWERVAEEAESVT